ncbi:PREDICTED: B-cell scaffold protein with ankyrin repeats-like [Ceratotherium simum simum]|uniref:B-cell scaffold protein with ankyrin repeats-like n=1 Tax=Ceratotherium simum simum TaxID=73337 RepID=A0ABM1CV34_CERSS|nr:PREDICTED: B-cell scaffold protein with ankyrin repeats-like [Ceratotherium simum simum]
MIYEEEAEEWALYLKEIFLHVVKREAILLYHLENYSLQDFELLSLNSYKCKLLILSSSLLKNLTRKKCQFLEKVLHSPESVVTLLCGVKSSDQLYKLLNVSGGRWEISTEQEPDDYISVIESIIFRGSEDYLEVDIPTDLRVEYSGKISERKEIEELSEASRITIPLAVVLPAEIPCENPGEIFIILRDELIGDTVEIEFTSSNKCIRTRPALWNKTVWCMKALDFPAGSVNVDVYCDGILKATTEIKYYTAAKAKECLLGVAGPGDGVCWNDIGELDDILTSIFKHEIPHYEFRALQTEIYPPEEYTHFKELPTLLHCAAKFGLKNLAIHLLRCSGATWASKVKNSEGSDPARIAETHGHRELKEIFEDFSAEGLWWQCTQGSKVPQAKDILIGAELVPDKVIASVPARDEKDEHKNVQNILINVKRPRNGRQCHNWNKNLPNLSSFVFLWLLSSPLACVEQNSLELSHVYRSKGNAVSARAEFITNADESNRYGHHGCREEPLSNKHNGVMLSE